MMKSGKGDTYAPFLLPNAPPSFATGKVLSYYPVRKIYEVLVDNGTTKECHRLLTGLDKPLVRGNRVVLGRFSGVDWLIFGGIDTLAPETRAVVDPVEEQLARKQSILSVLATEAPLTEKSVRPVDTTGIAEELQFAGDAGFENRDESNLQRSRVKIYSFGDIVIHASTRCFQFFHKLKNTIVTRANNLKETFIGYTRLVFTDTTGLNRGASHFYESFKARHTNLFLDKERSVGTLVMSTLAPSTDFFSIPLANQGERTKWGTHLVHEVDNITQTTRTAHRGLTGNVLSLQVGDFTAENGAHPITQRVNTETPTGVLAPLPTPAYAGTGALIQNGIHAVIGTGIELTVDAITNEIQLQNLPGLSRIIYSSTALVLENSGQYLKLTPEGLEIVVKSLKITAADEEVVVAGKRSVVSGEQTWAVTGDATLTAAVIKLN